MNTKLYLFLILFLFSVVSCVDNSDEPSTPPPPPEEKLKLTEENLLGTWEIYYFFKNINSASANISDNYRYTDFDGFTTTFEKGGTFYEKNVFDIVVRKGTYEIDEEKEQVNFYFKSKNTGIDTTTTVNFPYIYNNRFVYQEIYPIEREGHTFNVKDLKYCRNVERAPNYYPSENPAFDKKEIIDESELLGTWVLILKKTIVNGIPLEETEADRLYYGTESVFEIKNGKRVFKQYHPNNKTGSENGEYRIVDDVVHMYNVDTIIVDTIKNIVRLDTVSFMYWIQDWTNKGTDGAEIIIEGFRERRDDSPQYAREEKAYHRKKK